MADQLKTFTMGLKSAFSRLVWNKMSALRQDAAVQLHQRNNI